MKYICMNCACEYTPTLRLIKCTCGSALWVKPETSFNKNDLIEHDLTIWRYSRSFPIREHDTQVSFNEAITPLAKAKVSGVSILAKMDSLQPTGSFKDRGAALVINYLKNLGIKSIAEDSSGNGGSAYAGYAAKGKIECNIFVPAGTSLGKTTQTRMYGANCIEVKGTREDAAQAAINSFKTHGSYYVGHNWHPLFIEGVKSIAYEIWEQCGYKAPDNFVAPVSNGSLLAGAYLGFSELLRSGEIDKLPRLFGIQSEGIQPFVQVFNGKEIKTISMSTIAEGIKIQRSSRLNEVIEFVRTSKGRFISVSDHEIKVALKEMGKQGFFIEPTSAAAFAGIAVLLDRGDIGKEDLTVGVITGNGLKTTSAIQQLLNETTD
ncbi:threonine synthase [Vibrio sp. DW001]|uniref:threonine synthase n=1 Tax=Vibrio sp. DW001 TaxID=2912315 RepID=UPI0023AF58B4|nr:threonine synthase [Vibrio sp. DW001]WED28250.1 threonine synthase [Vibrio sp. DW001]